MNTIQVCYDEGRPVTLALSVCSTAHCASSCFLLHPPDKNLETKKSIFDELFSPVLAMCEYCGGGGYCYLPYILFPVLLLVVDFPLLFFCLV